MHTCIYTYIMNIYPLLIFAIAYIHCVCYKVKLLVEFDRVEALYSYLSACLW